MQIMECARAAGVSLDTVRHYARLGLINAVAGGALITESIYHSSNR